MGTVYDLEVESIANKNPESTVENKYDWIGTQEQYIEQRANGQIPDDWVCFITDDISEENGQIDLTNYVKKTGDETIDGIKTFHEQIVKHMNIDPTENLTEPAWNDVLITQAKDGTGIGIVQTWREGTQTEQGILAATKSPSGEMLYSKVAAVIKPDGTKYAYAPTPTELSNDTTIATTAYITMVLNALYPIGSLYLGTQATCPLIPLIPGSSWTLVGQDRSIQGSSSTNAANTTIEAGLPNITGEFTALVNNNHAKTATGVFGGTGRALSSYPASANISANVGSPAPTATEIYGYDIDASRSSSIYGNSTTVQPKAYVTNIWRRTA